MFDVVNLPGNGRLPAGYRRGQGAKCPDAKYSPASIYPDRGNYKSWSIVLPFARSHCATAARSGKPIMELENTATYPTSIWCTIRQIWLGEAVINHIMNAHKFLKCKQYDQDVSKRFAGERENNNKLNKLSKGASNYVVQKASTPECINWIDDGFCLAICTNSCPEHHRRAV